MKKTTFRKSIIVSVSLLFTLSGIAWACGWWYDEDEVNFSLFAPEVIHDANYQPFFRTFHALYQYDAKYDNVNDFYIVNIQEWSKYFDNKVDTSDLKLLLYTVTIKQVDSLISYIKKDNYPLNNIFKNSSLLHFDDKNRINDFLFYLAFAKRSELYAAFVEDPWADKKEENPRTNVKTINKMIANAQKAIDLAKNDFIRERYIFQIVRLYFYSNNYDACINYYRSHQAELLLDNSIKYRTMSYAAGALFRSKQYAEANYLYSLVYDNSPLQKVSAYLNFHPVEEADWQACLAMAKNKRERNVLWHLLGIYADPLRAMKEIYATEQTSDLLDLLLVRAINIEEEKFVPLRYFEGGAMNDSALSFNKDKINPALFEFIKMVADKDITHKPSVWNLAVGYLYLALGEFKKADKYLEVAQKKSANDLLINKQIRLLRAVNLIERTNKLDAKFEDQILKELLWLKSDSLPSLRNSNAYEWALKRLSEKYEKNSDLIRSECLDYMRNMQFYTDTIKAAAMLHFMDKLNKTEFEKFILTIHPYKREDIIDYQATKLVYQNKFEEAIAKYNANQCSGKELLGNPFLIHINDCHDCDHAASQKEKYTKLSFLEKMMKLKVEAEKGGVAAAKANFLLANGYYNMSYFGNSRVMYQTEISGYVDCFPFDSYVDYYAKEIQQNIIIYDCKLAEFYYKRAMELSTDVEFKAKCCFMAAKCEQNRFFMNKPKSFEGDFKSGEYFKQLKASYSKTKYYKEIIKECGYFRSFVVK